MSVQVVSKTPGARPVLVITHTYEANRRRWAPLRHGVYWDKALKGWRRACDDGVCREGWGRLVHYPESEVTCERCLRVITPLRPPEPAPCRP